jgi:beta-galactosidase
MKFIINLKSLLPNGVKVDTSLVSVIAVQVSYHPARREEHTCIVLADTSKQPASRWYAGSGMYRDVRLIVTDPVHIAHWGTYITCADISETAAEVSIRTETVNDSAGSADAVLHTVIDSPDGRQAGAVSTDLSLEPGERRTAVQKLTVRDPRLWSDETPLLYTAKSVLMKGDTGLDRYETPFSIRTAEFDVDRGFLINGVQKKLKGMCIHHTLGPLGSALNDHVLKRYLLELREMGCNAVRCAHNPFSPSFYRLCDELGLFVIDEIFDEWKHGKREYTYHRFFDEWWERDLTDQIRQNRNHPSIILWSIGNEIPEKGSEQGAETARMLQDRIHGLEPTRPVTAGMNGIEGANRSGFAGLLDVAGYNGGGDSVFKYDEDRKTWPDRKMYASEVPHTFATRGIYRTKTHFRDKNKPVFERMMKTEVPNLTEEEIFTDVPGHYYSSYDNSLVRISSQQSWRLIQNRDFMAREFRWTGIDYLGESLGWPAKYFQGGVLDLCGFRKDLFYLYRAMWTEEPLVHILPHWTHPGKEGAEIPVCIYTNCDEAELHFNGGSLGRKELRDTYDLFWYIPYEPGELKAAGYRNGRQVCGDLMRTAGTPDRILAEPDKTELRADGYDVCQLTVKIEDENGIFHPRADNMLSFEIKGEAELIGVANGDPASDEPFRADRLSAFNGMCFAAIQAGYTPGYAEVTISSPGLKAAAAGVVIGA